MVLILDGNSDIGAIVRRIISVLFDLFRALLRREQSEIVFFSLERLIFFYACATCSELTSGISTMGCIKNFC